MRKMIVLCAAVALMAVPNLILAQEARPRPRTDREVKHERPTLDANNPGRTAAALVSWASVSSLGERETVRRVIKEIAGNEPIVSALCREALEWQPRDHSRSLMALALVGETRSDVGEKCLSDFVRLPFPREGHVVEGEIIEQTALATLQAKAVDGLAYRRTVSADELVLRLVHEHPSRIVRAEAISAYLWNRNDTEDAKAEVAKFIRPDEKIFLDRVRRAPGEKAETFNAKLGQFLKNHPELLPPRPEKSNDTAGAHVASDCDRRAPQQNPPSSGKGH